MFGDTQRSGKVIGDVDVVYHDGLYHLFHLVLPNHDFIAHAVSQNGINWRRVRNAVFIGDPGSWDDLMLWTMHVTPDPHVQGRWRMFYTGLSRREQGRVQRIGVAVSNDLYQWTKQAVNWEDCRGKNDPDAVKAAVHRSQLYSPPTITSPIDKDSSYPLQAHDEFYEADYHGQRQTISFRDPYFFKDGDCTYLLMASRVNQGPLVRRGCVGLYEEVSPNHFDARPPLLHPRLYDDIEVPNLIRLEDQWYLIGSIREDAKVRYWRTPEIEKTWQAPPDNVLLASGNYAARVCTDPKGALVWNFFSHDPNDRKTKNMLPPPKRLKVDSLGHLYLRTFEGLDEFKRESIDLNEMVCLTSDGEQVSVARQDDAFELDGSIGFQAFAFDRMLDSFQLEATLAMPTLGKCGLFFRVDPETRDGYYLSLDLVKGVAQMRTWGTGPVNGDGDLMQFRTLQEGFWATDPHGETRIKLLVFGSYFEVSINDRVLLSLADTQFENGLPGFYVDSTRLLIRQPALHRFHSPTQTDQHLARG